METRNRNFWWLVALEATLLLSLPCWELTAIWAAPMGHPLRFAVSLVVTATAATFCNVGPAFFAGRYGGRWPHLSWALLVWLSLGYVEWLGSLGRTWAGFLEPMPRWLMDLGDWSGFAIAFAFLAVVIALVWVKSWWKGVVVAELLLGLGILIWALATSWKGLWVRNPHLSSGGLDHFDWFFVKGILLSASPCLVVGCFIGKMETRPSRLWLSGFVGVWLPLVLSVTLASLATQAGVNLHWRPSLFRDFTWALIGGQGRLDASASTLAVSTLSSTALVSAFSLKAMTPDWGRRFRWLVPAMICLLSYPISFVNLGSSDRLYFTFVSPLHEFWAGSLVIIGATAGLICVILQRTGKESI